MQSNMAKSFSFLVFNGYDEVVGVATTLDLARKLYAPHCMGGGYIQQYVTDSKETFDMVRGHLIETPEEIRRMKAKLTREREKMLKAAKADVDLPVPAVVPTPEPEPVLGCEKQLVAAQSLVKERDAVTAESLKAVEAAMDAEFGGPVLPSCFKEVNILGDVTRAPTPELCQDAAKPVYPSIVGGKRRATTARMSTGGLRLKQPKAVKDSGVVRI